MSSNKPLTAIVERLIERRKSGELPEVPKRTAKPKKPKAIHKLDASVPKNRTLH